MLIDIADGTAFWPLHTPAAPAVIVRHCVKEQPLTDVTAAAWSKSRVSCCSKSNGVGRKQICAAGAFGRGATRRGSANGTTAAAAAAGQVLQIGAACRCCRCCCKLSPLGDQPRRLDRRLQEGSRGHCHAPARVALGNTAAAAASSQASPWCMQACHGPCSRRLAHQRGAETEGTGASTAANSTHHSLGSLKRSYSGSIRSCRLRLRSQAHV